MKSEILQIIQRECELEATPAFSDALADLGVDSFAVICAVQALEERFEIQIPLDADLAEFNTVGDIVAMVEQLMAGENRP